jgi:hypothetical protein
MGLETQVEDSVRGADKIARYKWKLKDKPGLLETVPKELLRVNEEYQRAHNIDKALKLAGNWSWIACGCLIVAYRDGEYWVIDGGHRTVAAMHRSDIDLLPCIIFETEGIEQEAQGFLDSNTNRKPMTMFDRHRARLVINDPVAVMIQKEADAQGVTLGKYARRDTVRCLSQLYYVAERWPEVYRLAFKVCCQLAKREAGHVGEKLFLGVWYLLQAFDHDRRLIARMNEIGALKLEQGALKASAYYARGGARIWAEGMLTALNFRLRVKFIMPTKEEETEGA